MMKQLFLTVTVIFSCIVTMAQGYEASLEYDKKKQSAVARDFYFTQEAVEKGLSKRMEKMGFSGKDEKGLFNRDKGFKVYKNLMIHEITSSVNNYYFKAETRGKKDNPVTTLYVIVVDNSGNNLFTTGTNDDRQRAKSFLNGLTNEIEVAELELKIADQEDVVSKAEKKLKLLKDDKDSMEKKIAALQDSIKKNITDQENTEKDIEAQKKTLENLRSKRN